MSSTLSAARWRTDGNTTDFTAPFSDGNETVFMTAWPMMFHQDFLDDPSAPSAPLPVSRRMMPEEPQDQGKPAPTAGKKKEPKKSHSTPSSDPRGAPKRHKPVKKPDPPPAPVAKKPPPAPTPVKKNKGNSGNLKKNRPSPEPDSPAPAPPEATPEVSGGGELPPSPPVIATGSLPPEEVPEDENDSGTLAGEPILTADSDTDDSQEAGIPDLTPASLTDEAEGVFIDEQANTEENGFQSFFSKAEDFFRHLLGNNATEKTDAGNTESYSYTQIPVALPPPRNPAVDLDPVGSFRAGYISQRDLETAIGRDEWTMCCAATFIYAVQSKYPGLSRDEIIEAAGRAANAPLSDGSGSIVSDNGYIRSIYQYSQALSENLGLDEYIDTPGTYPSIEAAREAGIDMMKVELSGAIRRQPQEHHVMQLNGVEIDPAGENGIEKIWDEGSRKEVSVMALDWYSLP